MRLAKERDECVLHVDIGGGTTKLALIDQGVILGVAAFAVGGRLLAADESGAWTRVDDSARLVAQELGLATDPATLADVAVRRQIAQRLATIAADYILDAPRDALGQALLLTEELAATGARRPRSRSRAASRNTSSATRSATTATSPSCSAAALGDGAQAARQRRS